MILTVHVLQLLYYNSLGEDMFDAFVCFLMFNVSDFVGRYITTWSKMACSTYTHTHTHTVLLSVSVSVCLSVSLSLSLSHTHTHSFLSLPPSLSPLPPSLPLSLSPPSLSLCILLVVQQTSLLLFPVLLSCSLACGDMY